MTDGPQPLFPLPQGPESHRPQSSCPQVGTQQSAPGANPPGGLSHKVWAIVAVISVVVIAVTAAVTLLLSGSESDPAPTSRTAIADSHYAEAEISDSLPETNQRENNRPDPARSSAVDRFQAAPPPLIVREPDTFDEVCASGFQMVGQSGWGTHSGRGSSQTSCFFAQSVLHAYWQQHGTPDGGSRVVVAAGTVPCGTTGGECSGDRFVMRCAVHGQNTWITCNGGKNARVYIY